MLDPIRVEIKRDFLFHLGLLCVCSVSDISHPYFLRSACKESIGADQEVHNLGTEICMLLRRLDACQTLPVFALSHLR